METAEEYWLARALLDWHVELGADESIGDSPVNRYDLAEPISAAARQPAASRAAPPPIPAAAPTVDAPAEARKAAEAASSLDELAAAMRDFDLCEVKKGARKFCFSDGNPAASVMIIGEAPGREEDLEGRPFVGRAGQMLDRMFAAIGLSRGSPDSQESVYITNVLPWRPPSNRTPDAAEIAMMVPFLERHVALVDPDVICLMGNTPLTAVLNETGITRLRGQWAEAYGKPVMPMLHPAYLLRQTAAKKQAWADLLAVKARLETKP